MIIVLKKGATQRDIDALTNLITQTHGVQVSPALASSLVPTEELLLANL